MTPGERYRVKAFELFARAEVESSPFLKVEFDDLAAAYLRLAEQAALTVSLARKQEADNDQGNEESGTKR